MLTSVALWRKRKAPVLRGAGADVVVFKLPRDNSTDYVNRMIGLPGDEITVRGGLLSINGKEVPRRRRVEKSGSQFGSYPACLVPTT